MLEGVSFSLQQSELPMVIQSDNAAVIAAVMDESLNKSAFGYLIMEVKKLLEPRDFILQKIDRIQNSVAYSLAVL